MRRVCAEFNARLRVVYTVNFATDCSTILAYYSTTFGASFNNKPNFLCYSAYSTISECMRTKK